LPVLPFLTRIVLDLMSFRYQKARRKRMKKGFCGFWPAGWGKVLAREKAAVRLRRLHVLRDAAEEDVNHKRVHACIGKRLSIRRKKRKTACATGQPLRVCTAANQEWALDFVHERGGKAGERSRVLSVVDAYTRECLALQVDTSFASRRVTRVLEGNWRNEVCRRRFDATTGRSLTSRHFLAWCIERKIELVHIQPGRPMQNGRVESFNGRMREECLNVSWFGNLFEARERIAVWRREL